MPFTPYHFGPNGFVGLVFKKWLDMPALILANVAVDVEVAVIWSLKMQWPHHRYCHTFLVGSAVGIALAVILYLFRRHVQRFMQLRLVKRIYPFHSEHSFLIILISSVLGVWLHVFVDAFDHWDVKPFWPLHRNPFSSLATDHQIKTVCLAFWLAAIGLWAIYLIIGRIRNKQKRKC